jgi:hypothetical protein
MKSLIATIVGRQLHTRRLVMSTSLLAVPLAVALVLAGGCYCPHPDHAKPVVDSPQHADAIKAQLVAAEAKKLWTADDERAFRYNLGHLSAETRIASATKLAALINSKAVRIDRTPSKTPPAPTCPCTPGLCDGTPGTPATPGTTATPGAPMPKMN